jgi:hypothetical protein
MRERTAEHAQAPCIQLQSDRADIHVLCCFMIFLLLIPILMESSESCISVIILIIIEYMDKYNIQYVTIAQHCVSKQLKGIYSRHKHDQTFYTLSPEILLKPINLYTHQLFWPFFI